MGNMAYLCCADLRRTYPSFQNPRFAPERHTVAAARAAVPLLWLGLFRAEDLRRDRFVVDGEVDTSYAPLVARRVALGRLDAARARLEGVFPKAGPLTRHAELLAEAVRGMKGRYLSIELEEIAALWSRRASFDRALEQALAYVGGARVPGIRRTLLALTQLHAREPFPAPDGFYDRRQPRARAENLVRLLGASHIREVPWERTAPRPARPASADELLSRAAATGVAAEVRKLVERASPAGRSRALCVAMFKGHEAVARGLLRAGADPNCGDKLSGTPWQNVFWGRVGRGMLGALIRAGGDVDRKTRGHDCPLIQAAWVGKPEMLRALIRAGADVHALDAFRRSALAITARAGHPEAALVLLRAGMTGAEIQAAVREGQRTLADPTTSIEPPRRKAIEATIALLAARAGRG